MAEPYVYQNPMKKTWDRDCVVTLTFPEETTIEQIDEQVDELVKLADNNELFTFTSHQIDLIEEKIDEEDDI
tara:strand:- start:8670 stop:8885 length:216 start_codon:yes stop_codon:yes gene_type:complete